MSVLTFEIKTLERSQRDVGVRTTRFLNTSFVWKTGAGDNIPKGLQPVIVEKHSCWICQEEMSSEAFL